MTARVAMTANALGNGWREMTGAMLSQVEREWLRDAAASIAERFESPLMLNIGVYKGASMYCLRAGAPGATLVGIDVARREIQGMDVLRAELIWQDSRRVGWDRPIHLLFVDGGHSRGVVRSDIRRFGQHMVVGGMMAFHDYARSSTFLKERAGRRPGRGPLEVRETVDEWLLSEARRADTQRADTQVRPYWEDLGTTDSIKALRRVRQ